MCCGLQSGDTIFSRFSLVGFGGCLLATGYGVFSTSGPIQMAAIAQTTLSNTFSWMKIYEFVLWFHWISFLRVQITLFPHSIRQWLDAPRVTSHFRNQWWLVYWRIYASLGFVELILFVLYFAYLDGWGSILLSAFMWYMPVVLYNQMLLLCRKRLYTNSMNPTSVWLACKTRRGCYRITSTPVEMYLSADLAVWLSYTIFWIR